MRLAKDIRPHMSLLHVAVTWHEGSPLNARVPLLCFLSLSSSFPMLTYPGFWQLFSSLPKGWIPLRLSKLFYKPLEPQAIGTTLGWLQLTQTRLSLIFAAQPPWHWCSRLSLSDPCFSWSSLFFTMGALWKQLPCWMSAGGFLFVNDFLIPFCLVLRQHQSAVSSPSLEVRWFALLSQVIPEEVSGTLNGYFWSLPFRFLKFYLFSPTLCRKSFGIKTRHS